MPGVISPTLASRLIRLQSFKETVWGTPGLATARWMGVQPYPSFKPYKKSTLFDEDRGSLQNNFLSAIVVEGGEFSINMHATYEEIVFMLNGGLQAVDPTGGGPNYTWTYAAPTDAAWAAQSYTFEYGYDIGTIGASGAFINKWSIKGAAKKQWEASMSGFFKRYYNNAAIAIASSTAANPSEITTAAAHGLSSGMQVVISGHETNTSINGTWTITVTGATTFTVPVLGNGVGGATGTVTKIQTPAIADRSVEVILFPGTLLYMEASGGTLGTTNFPSQLMSFSLDVTAGLMPVYGSDDKTPQAWTYDRVTPTLSLRLLWTAQAKAFLNNVLEAGQRTVVQLSNTSGAKSATLNFSGVMQDDPSFFPNEQSAKSVDFKLEGQYESTSIANDLGAEVVNGVAALP